MSYENHAGSCQGSEAGSRPPDLLAEKRRAECHGRRPAGPGGADPCRQRSGSGSGQRHYVRRDAGPSGPESRPDRRYGPGDPGGGGTAGPGRAGFGGTHPPRRAENSEGLRPHGRHRHHLREPAQRHQRRRGPGAEKRQRLRPAGRQGGLPQRQRHCGRPARRSEKPGHPGKRRESGAGHLPLQRHGADDRQRLHRPADPQRRRWPHQRLRPHRHRPLHRHRHRDLPRLRGKNRRPGHGAEHCGERQDQPPQRLQCRGGAAGGQSHRPPVPAHAP